MFASSVGAVPFAFSERSFPGSLYVSSLSLIRFPAKKAPAVAGAVQIVAEKQGFEPWMPLWGILT